MTTLERRLAALEQKTAPGDDFIVFNTIVSPDDSGPEVARMVRWAGSKQVEEWHRSSGETEDDFRSRVVAAVTGRGFVVLHCYGGDTEPAGQGGTT